MSNLVWGIPVLVVTDIILASGATAFIAISDISDQLKCAVRLQVTVCVLFCMQMNAWINRRSDCIQLWRCHAQRIAGAGTAYALHFLAYTEALSHTSVSHCLILGSTETLFLLSNSYWRGHTIIRQEVLGVALSLMGISIISSDISSEAKASLYGDLLSIVSAAMYAIYLILCQDILKDGDLPFFHYFFSINVVASLVCSLTVVIISTSETPLLVSWVATSDRSLLLYLGLGPGFIGQMILNLMLKYLSAVLITVFTSLECIFGIYLGWFFGFQDIPPALTWLGGVVCIVGCTLVTLAGQTKTEEYEAIPSEEQHELTKV